MTRYLEYFFIFALLITPITLITGPAAPDLTITFAGIFFIYLTIYKKNFKIINKDWVMLSIVFWLYLIFISLFAIDKNKAIGEALIFIRLLVIPILMYWWLLKDQKNIKILVSIIFVCIFFVSIDTFYQFINYSSKDGFGSDIFGFVPDFAPHNRLTGPFQDLVPGAYVSKFGFIGLLFGFIYIKNISYLNFFIIFYLTIIGIITFISGERMAVATFSLGLLLLIIFGSKKRIIFLFSGIFFLIFSYIITTVHPSYNDYTIIKSDSKELGLIIEKRFECEILKTKICSKQIEYQPRFFEVLKNFKKSAYGEIYFLAINMYKEKIYTGIGLNNFQSNCINNKNYYSELNNIGCVTHPHNFYLQWLIETGPLGLTIFILYIILIAKNIIYHDKKNIINIISFITLIIIFWPIMSTGSLLKNWMGVSTFYIIGILISLPKLIILQKN